MRQSVILTFFILALMTGKSALAQEEAWEPIPAMPTARESLGACAAGGRIFAMGGFPGTSDPGIDTNERFDPASNAWSTAAPMPTARRMPAVVEVGGRCYAIGGRITDGPTPLNATEVYDPASDSWQSLPPMPTARYGHGAVAIGEMIYVAGGSDGQVGFRVFEAFNSSNNNWTTLPDHPENLALMGMVAFEEEIWTLGGTSNGLIGSSQVFIYNPVTQSWRTGPALPSGRFSLQGAAAGGRIWAIGGTTGSGALTQVTTLDPASEVWSQAPPLNITRSRFASAVLEDTIYVVGGTVMFEGQTHVGLSTAERLTAQHAPEFVMNPGLNDAWYNPETSGQGFFINVFPEANVVFLAWFTYDTQRPPDSLTAVLGEPGHRWLTAAGSIQGNQAQLEISSTSGGVFDSALPAPVTDAVGTLRLTFDDCNAATVDYELPAISVSGSINIQRVVKDNIALCELLAQGD